MSRPDWQPPHPPQYGGVTFDPATDTARLNKQCLAVYQLMRDGKWRTPTDIENATGYNWASASARLRDLRKERFGSFSVERRRKGDAERGLFEYRLLHPEPREPDLLTSQGTISQDIHQ